MKSSASLNAFFTFLIAALLTPPMVAQEFISLGVIDGCTGSGSGGAIDVSFDGSVIVGHSCSLPFVWKNGVMSAVDGIPNTQSGAATGVSDDGKTIVGYSAQTSFTSWRKSGDVVETIPVYQARGVSGDGKVVFGDRLINGSSSQVWTWVDGVQTDLEDFPGGALKTFAYASNFDGSVICGYGSGQNASDAAVWTNGSISNPVVNPPNNSWVSGVSGDGKVVVGSRRYIYSVTSMTDVGFRIEDGTETIISFETPAATSRTFVYDVSFDGSTVLGRALIGSSAWEAFVWTEKDGYKTIRSILTDGGVDMTGWTNINGSAISGDGRVVVGSAQALGGSVSVPFRAELKPAPPKLVVNSTADRGRKAGATGCETGEMIANGDPECTLRSVIEGSTLVSGTKSPLTFPGTPSR